MDVIQELLQKVKMLERKISALERMEHGGGGSGVTDHGALTGLGDDDHSQYYNQARGDARYAPLAKGVTNGDSHNHAGGDGAQIDHTGLSNLNSVSYTHLTAANHTDLTDGGETTLHTHATFVPVTPATLVESGGATFQGGRNTGTYTFRPADNSNLWPATAKGVLVLLYSQWAGASDTYLASLRRSSGGANEVQVRALVAGIGYSVQGLIAVDASGYFYCVVEGSNSASTILRILGYFV